MMNRRSLVDPQPTTTSSILNTTFDTSECLVADSNPFNRAGSINKNHFERRSKHNASPELLLRSTTINNCNSGGENTQIIINSCNATPSSRHLSLTDNEDDSIVLDHDSKIKYTYIGMTAPPPSSLPLLTTGTTTSVTGSSSRNSPNIFISPTSEEETSDHLNMVHNANTV